MDQIRSFIAIELPEELKAGLKKIQNCLKSDNPTPIKWVDPNSIHLTLKFMGDVTLDKIDAVTRGMGAAAHTTGQLNLEVKEVGAFPNLSRVQVIWVGLVGDVAQLQSLQENIEAHIAPLGFPTEKRSFTPHLTLARVRDYATFEERESLGGKIARTKIETSCSFKVNSISLMKSELTRIGAIYTRLASIELKPSCE